jgi:hypothetical protein
VRACANVPCVAVETAVWTFVLYGSVRFEVRKNCLHPESACVMNCKDVISLL